MRKPAPTLDMQIFYDAFNASPIGIAVESLEGHALFANPALCSMLDIKESEVLGRHCVEYSSVEDAEKDRALFQQLQAGSIDHYQLESRFRRRDGSLFWGRLSLSLWNNSPSVLVIAMVEDITENKRAQDALRESEARYRGILETANEGVWMLDSKLHNSYLNRQTAEMLGYEPAEMVGRGPLDFSFPEDVERQKEILARCRGGQRQQFEERLRRKDGTELWVRVAATPIYKDNGEFDGALAMISDVTEHRRAQEAMRESEERFRLVANTAPVMIWMSGLDKRPTYFNQLWLDFTGLSESDLKDGLSAIVHPEDYAVCHDTYCRGFDQRQPFRKECRLRRHDGEYRWMLDIGIPRFHRDGSFAGYIGSCVDITDQKLAEQLQSSMTRKLVDAQEKERARIARELHDDINQRLALLSLDIEQLRVNPSEIETRVLAIQKYLEEISKDLGALAHDLHPSMLEYLGAVAAMRSWSKDFAQRHGLKVFFTTSVSGLLPSEIGVTLFRVLQEALQNSIKHSGGKRVEVQLQDASETVRLVVRDWGKGFDVESASYGNGIGLTSMRERVRLVNGTITIDSQPNGGTSIQVLVPIRTVHHLHAG